MRALFIGRFQPLHKGHMKYIEEIQEETDSLTIVIGSSTSHDAHNPLTSAERRQMLEACLPGTNIIEIPDIPGDNTAWKKQIEDKVEFDIVYTGDNEIVRNIFEEEYPVRTRARYKNISATAIREAVRAGRKWRHLVPECAQTFLDKIGFERRR